MQDQDGGEVQPLRSPGSDPTPPFPCFVPSDSQAGIQALLCVTHELPLWPMRSQYFTCHIHRELILAVIPFYTPFFHSEEVRTAVTPLCISDVQRAVVGTWVPKEVELALSLLHRFIWLVCSHW